MILPGISFEFRVNVYHQVESRKHKNFLYAIDYFYQIKAIIIF